MSGLDVAGISRVQVPLIMLTAKADEVDKLLGLERWTTTSTSRSA